MRLLVIGGTHFVGRHAVELAAARGHEVTVFHRGGSEPGHGFPQVEHVHGDRDGGLGPLKGGSWDAVLDTCGYVPRVVRESAMLLADAAEHYTFVSSLSAYPDEVGPGATEETPSHGAPFPDTEEVTGESYGPLKVACEIEVRRAFPGRASIVRPGFIVGPHDPIDRFPYWVRRSASGGAMLAPEPADLAVQIVDVRDLAMFMIDHAEKRTPGVFNVTGPEGVFTMRQLLEACVEAGAAGTRIVWAGLEFLRERGLHEPGEHGWEQLPYWYTEEPGFSEFDISKALAAGLSVRPLAQTIADTLAWDRTREQIWPMGAGLDPQRERELLAELRGEHGSSSAG
ncbi:MAG TPA: epimerase [Actinomycetota bacterium]|nr:epimerase [Actinomycetota bacterium]